MRATALAVLVCCALSGCIGTHLRKEIQPPGGCDQCHRGRILSGWTVGLAPVAFGKDGGMPESRDILLRELRAVPVHAEVPLGRLKVYAATVPPAAVGDSEEGIQCFLCHESPGPPHEGLKGTFPHPWGRPSDHR